MNMAIQVLEVENYRWYEFNGIYVFSLDWLHRLSQNLVQFLHSYFMAGSSLVFYAFDLVEFSIEK